MFLVHMLPNCVGACALLFAARFVAVILVEASGQLIPASSAISWPGDSCPDEDETGLTAGWGGRAGASRESVVRRPRACEDAGAIESCGLVIGMLSGAQRCILECSGEAHTDSGANYGGSTGLGCCSPRLTSR